MSNPQFAGPTQPVNKRNKQINTLAHTDANEPNRPTGHSRSRTNVDLSNYTIQNLPMVELGHWPAQRVAARQPDRCSGPTINIENVTYVYIYIYICVLVYVFKHASCVHYIYIYTFTHIYIIYTVFMHTYTYFNVYMSRCMYVIYVYIRKY